MTKDVIIQALKKGRDAENRCLLNNYYVRTPTMEKALQLYEQALTSLQGSIVIDKADVPDDIRRVTTPYREGGARGNECLDLEALHTLRKCAQLIVEGLKDE